MVETENVAVDRLEENRQIALQALNQYLESPEEHSLREHQTDVFVSLRDFLAQGETAGYISLPPGSGKSNLAGKLISSVGLRGVVLSPTNIIRRQNEGHINSFGNGSSNFQSMTYQGFIRGLEKGEIDPQQIDLLICDEAHTGLGEIRHTIYRQLPHALMLGLTATPFFGQIEGYKSRGLLDLNERWVGLFKNRIAEMSLEEGIERGILSPVDIHLIKTSASIADIEIQALGYNRAQLERALNTYSRNILVLAMIMGLENYQPITFNAEQTEDLKQIHQKIKGRKTAIFGLSVQHVEDLAAQLQKMGIKAAAIHGGMNNQLRENILEEYRNGDIQVILGVDVLSIGWDSPETEVGIYMAPTESGTVAVQQLGRILRISEGKEKAIAIQLVDEFQKAGQAPVLIPHIFNPLHILRGLQNGKAFVSKEGNKRGIHNPVISFSGVSINSIIEQTQSQSLLHKRLKEANLVEISQALDSLIEDTGMKYPEASILQFYQRLAEQLPFFIPGEVSTQIMQSLASIDTNKVYEAKKVAPLLFIRSILSAAEGFLGENDDENDEIIQTAILGVVEKLENLSSNNFVAAQINKAARDAIQKFLAGIDKVPIGWEKTVPGFRKAVVLTTGYDQIETSRILSNGEIADLASEIQAVTNIPQDEVIETMRKRMLLNYDAFKVEDEPVEEVNQTLLEEALERWHDHLLTPRSWKVLELRYGFGSEDRPHTLDEIAGQFDVSRERIREIEFDAMRDLRGSINFMKEMRRYFDGGWEKPYFPLLPEIVNERPKVESEVELDYLNLSPDDRIAILRRFADLDLDTGVYIPENQIMRLKRAGVNTVGGLLFLTNEQLADILQLGPALGGGVAKPYWISNALASLLNKTKGI